MNLDSEFYQLPIATYTINDDRRKTTPHVPNSTLQTQSVLVLKRFKVLTKSEFDSGRPSLFLRKASTKEHFAEIYTFPANHP